MKLFGEIIAFIAIFGAIPHTVVEGNDEGVYTVGVGIADVTGPIAEIGMMGYASLSQSATGLHIRLFSRAFYFQSGSETPVVFVSADLAMLDQGITTAVANRLSDKYGEDVFSERNILLSGTHTHSGPGAFMQYLLYGITTLGFHQGSFDAIVDGIVQSVERAYENRQEGKIFINSGKVQNANRNRSPSSYYANPQEERDMYEDGETDKTMVLLRIEDKDGNKLGMINWFAVHPTSMRNNNTLISGDNKGYASMLFEYDMNPGKRPGKGSFVAAFASSNLGDVSPNLKDPICTNNNQPCDYRTSKCFNDKGWAVNTCEAFGPGEDMIDSTRIIAERQYAAARILFDDPDNNATQIKGSIGFKHQYIDMSNQKVTVRNPITNLTEEGHTCLPALGFSFAAGTTDGPGAFSFEQGDTKEEHLIWDAIKNLLQKPSPEDIECHWPKPILLNVGKFTYPYEWVAKIVGTQLLKIGNLYIAGVPGELTTMSGRRLRKAVKEFIVASEDNPDAEEPHVVVGGLSNVYTHYVATYEEYQEQRYEAGSTLFGPHTLNAYIQQYVRLAEHLLKKNETVDEATPPDLGENKLFSIISPILMDRAPMLKTFGQVLKQPVSVVDPAAGEVVQVEFAGGHPRHYPLREGSFLLVEKQVGQDQWEIVATDADWSTQLRWRRPWFLSLQSRIEITWDPKGAEPGYYRIRHFGYAKPGLKASPRAYQGVSLPFQVAGPGVDALFNPDWSPEERKPSKIHTARDFWHVLGARK